MTGELKLSLKDYNANEFILLDNQSLCGGCNDGIIRVWDITTRELILTLYRHDDAITTMVGLMDGDICSASDDGTIKVWFVQTGKPKKASNL